jgi:hypothetical protein
MHWSTTFHDAESVRKSGTRRQFGNFEPEPPRITHMAKLFPLESATNDPKVGGFIVEFPSGARKSAHWVSGAPFQDSLEAAKKHVTTLVQHCLDCGLIDDLERTNIPSLVAAVQKIILDWNERQRAALYVERDAPTIQ